MKEKGRIGCGCLTLLVIVLVAAAVSVHPLTLRFIGSRFEYADKISSAEVILVPFFTEDRQGELHTEAIREFLSGAGRKILVEDGPLFTTTVYRLFLQMAKERGVKERDTSAIETRGDLEERIAQMETFLNRKGIKSVLFLSPSYASLRLHLLLRDREEIKFFVKPCAVMYFRKDTWWKDPLSRSLLVKEMSAICSYYLRRFKYGKKKQGEG